MRRIRLDCSGFGRNGTMRTGVAQMRRVTRGASSMASLSEASSAPRSPSAHNHVHAMCPCLARSPIRVQITTSSLSRRRCLLCNKVNDQPAGYRTVMCITAVLAIQDCNELPSQLMELRSTVPLLLLVASARIQVFDT